jgi:hypothetical protein
MADYRDDIYKATDALFAKMDGSKDHFADLPLEDPTPYEQAGIPLQPVGWVENASPDIDGAATVTIDSDGITILNGALTLVDDYGNTVLTGAGFSGTWNRFLISGLYNNAFDVGEYAEMTFAAPPSTDEVPYWAFTTRSHLSIAIHRVFASSSAGDSVISIQQQVSHPGEQAYGYIQQDNLACQGGRAMIARVNWRAEGASFAEPQRIRIVFDWYDSDGAFISATVVDTPDRTTTGAVGTYEWNTTAPAVSPVNAITCSVKFGGLWNVGSSSGITAIEIAEVVAEVHDYEFQQLRFESGTPVTVDLVEFPQIRYVSDNANMIVTALGASNSGTISYMAQSDTDSWGRAAFGIESGTPFLSFGGGSTFDVNLTRAGGILRLDTGFDVEGTIVAGKDTGTPITLSASGYVEFLERSDPAAPSSNNGRLYVRDTGGKTQLVVRFPTGAIQVIATEP